MFWEICGYLGILIGILNGISILRSLRSRDK